MLAPEVFITCAVTGSADSVRKNPNVPVTPVVELLGVRVLTARETRERLGLRTGSAD